MFLLLVIDYFNQHGTFIVLFRVLNNFTLYNSIILKQKK